MTVVGDPVNFDPPPLFVDLEDLLGHPLLLKCEGFNFGGSVKMKVARSMVDKAERVGELYSGRRIIESSSGNLGLALSIVAASRRIPFTCITDVRCNVATVAAMRALGAEVRIVSDPDPVRGYLGARLDLVRSLCHDDPSYLWLNQYENSANWEAHYTTTAREVVDEIPDVDVLFVGAGTTGTLTGCARFMADHRPDVQVVGVDSVGSVNFGGPAGPRFIPGLGSGVPPKLLDLTLLAGIVQVEEIDAVQTCWRLAAAGYLFGGSTGTVVAGACAWLADHPSPRPRRAVAVSPDLGERYLSTIYDESWISANFPGLVLPASAEASA